MVKDKGLMIELDGKEVLLTKEDATVLKGIIDKYLGASLII